MTGTAKSATSVADVRIRTAGHADLGALTALINAAFVVEQVVFDGDRVDAGKMRQYMNVGTFLLAEAAGVCVGCVYVQLLGDRSYLGLLSVDPSRQGLGLGRKLVAAAEAFAREMGARAMDLRVVSARSELLPFYHRVGYRETGTAPFLPNATPKIPSHFILMSKQLN